MATRVFYEGQTVRLSGTFTDADGIPVDPSAVVFTVQDPTGDVTTPAATKDAVGSYHVDILANPGDPDDVWRWKLEGTGANPQVQFSAFKVLPAPIVVGP